MKTLGIAKISVYLPSGIESNLGKLARFGIEPGFLRDKIGVETVTRLSEGEDTSDMAERVLTRLIEAAGIAKASLQCLVVCTQNPDNGGIPHVSANIHGRLGLAEECACFDIGLGCSGYVYGLSVLKAFMQANAMNCGVLVTADPYSKIVDPDDKNTALLFGDAATATLLNDQGDWIPGPFRFSTRGRDSDSLKCVDGRLKMNGRAVFNFAASVVPPQILALLEDARLPMGDVERFYLHQGSKYIVETIRDRLGLDAERVPVRLRDQGNTVSSSIPLMLADDLDHLRGYVQVLCGFGVGVSWASCLLMRRNGKNGEED